MQTERGLYVGHIVLEAGTHDFIEPWTLLAIAFPRIAIHPVKPPGSGARNQVGSADQHSALRSAPEHPHRNPRNRSFCRGNARAANGRHLR